MYLPKRILESAVVWTAVAASACGAAGEEEFPGEFADVEAEVTTGATYTLKGVHSGLCLDLANGSSADGANIQLWTCNGLTAQQFRFESKGNGYFQVRNVASNKCLDVWGKSTADGANVAQYTCTGGDNQLFSVPDVRSGGVVRLVAKHSGKALDAWGWGTTPGTNIAQWPVTGGDNQHFVMTLVGSSGGSTGGTTGGTSGGTTETIPTTIPAANGTEVMSSTKRLPAGVHDFGNKRVGVDNPEGCDGEGQPAVFELDDGATVKNLIVHGGTPGGNGIVCKGSCTLENVYWEDVCEDAATNSKDGAVMRINRAIALHATDKVFQHNAKGGARTIITNSYIADFGKVWRSCGDCTNNGGPRHVELNNVKVDGVGSTVIGLNENYGDTATIRNLFIKGGYDAGDDDPHVCQVFKGVQKGSGSSTKLYGGKSQFNTTTCNVSLSDLKSW